MDTMSVAIGGFVLLFVLRGAWHGLSGEVAPLAGLVACGGVLWFGYAPLHALVARLAVEPGAAVFYSALGIVVIGCVAFLLVAKLLKGVVRLMLPQPFDGVLGAAIGAAKAILIVSVAAGVATVTRERMTGLLDATERNPVAAAAGRFWAERLTDAAIPEPEETHAGD